MISLPFDISALVEVEIDFVLFVFFNTTGVQS